MYLDVSTGWISLASGRNLFSSSGVAARILVGSGGCAFISTGVFSTGVVFVGCGAVIGGSGSAGSFVRSVTPSLSSSTSLAPLESIPCFLHSALSAK